MEKKQSKLTGLLVLVVFALFALCILLVLLTGAKVYDGVVQRGQTAWEYRTAAQYLATRVRQSDAAGALAVEDFGGESALVIRQEIGGEVYATRIYCYEGWLRELFSAENGGFSPEDGEKLLEMAFLRFAWEEGGLSAWFETGVGTKEHLFWNLRSGEVLP